MPYTQIDISALFVFMMLYSLLVYGLYQFAKSKGSAAYEWMLTLNGLLVLFSGSMVTLILIPYFDLTREAIIPLFTDASLFVAKMLSGNPNPTRAIINKYDDFVILGMVFMIIASFITPLIIGGRRKPKIETEPESEESAFQA